MPTLLWKPLDDVSSSPRSLSPPPWAITPQRSEVRQRDLYARPIGLHLPEWARSAGRVCPPVGLFSVPAVKGLHS